MKKMLKLSGLIAIAVMTALTVAACSSGSDDSAIEKDVVEVRQPSVYSATRNGVEYSALS